MSSPNRRIRRRRRNIRIRQNVKLIEKNDKTRVVRTDSLRVRRAPIRITGDNAANFRIKIRRKQ